MLGLRDLPKGQESDVDANETVISSSSSESIEVQSNNNEDDIDDNTN